MKYVYGFFAVAVIMILLDAVWFKFVIGALFKYQLGELMLDSPR